MTGMRDGLIAGDAVSFHRTSQIFSLYCFDEVGSIFEAFTGNLDIDFCGDMAGDATGLGRSGLKRRFFTTGILLTLALLIFLSRKFFSDVGEFFLTHFLVIVVVVVVIHRDVRRSLGC
jgi:hypothetical protein